MTTGCYHNCGGRCIIYAEVQDGVVKLSGSVPHRLMKRLAEDLAEACAGVRDVDNGLRVGASATAGFASGASAEPLV